MVCGYSIHYRRPLTREGFGINNKLRRKRRERKNYLLFWLVVQDVWMEFQLLVIFLQRELTTPSKFSPPPIHFPFLSTLSSTRHVSIRNLFSASSFDFCTALPLSSKSPSAHNLNKCVEIRPRTSSSVGCIRYTHFFHILGNDVATCSDQILYHKFHTRSRRSSIDLEETIFV